MIDTALIFGKNPLTNLVGVEVEDDKAILFREIDGKLGLSEVPQRFWILFHERHGEPWTRLKGNAYYSYARNYRTREDYLDARKRLRGHDTYSIFDAKESFLTRYGYTFFKGMRPTDTSILSFDIETNGLLKNSDSRIFLISNTFRKNGVVTKKLFSFDEYENDGEMLAAWCDWVTEMDPSILVGHNINLFDLPYMQHVAELHGKRLRLGRNASSLWFNTYESSFRKDQTQSLQYNKVNVWGRQVVDTMFLASKSNLGGKWESLGLKYLVKTEGLENPNRTFYDASKIRFNYNDPVEWKKIKSYAIDDSDDALNLYDKLVPPFFYTTQSVPKSFQLVTESASGSQINSILVRSYLQLGYGIPKASEVGYFEGGLSLGCPGLYKNALKVDLKSAYPSTIIQFELYDHLKDPEANFLKITKFFTGKRLEYKQLAKDTGNEHYKHLETTYKILINSLFGACSTQGLNFNSPAIAAEITERCRGYLKDAIYWATGQSVEYWKEKNV